MKISISHSQHNLPFPSIKKLSPKILNLAICFGFQIIQFKIQEMAFKLCTKQSTEGKSREGKHNKICTMIG